MRMRWIAAAGLGLVALGTYGLFAGLVPPELVPPPRTDIVISGVTVIDPGAGRRANQTIVVHDGRIFAVRPREAGDPPPVCAGCYAVPGLIDAHVHTPPSIVPGNQRLFALLYLAYGVTSVRDMGQSDESVAGLAADLNAGRIVGPHMYRCGPVLDGDPPGWPSALEVVTPAQGRAAVAKLAREGVDCIKVYNEVNRPTYDAIAQEADRHGLPMLGHVPFAVTLRGLHDFEAQHLTGFPYLSRPRPPHGTDVRGEDLLAMSDGEIDSVLDLVQRNRIALTPTMGNPPLRLIASDPRRFPPTPGAADIPAFWASAWNLIAGHPEGEKQIQVTLRSLRRTRDIVRRAHARGIDVLAGTDTLMPWIVPGEALHLEMARLADAFGSNDAALAAATIVNGRHIAPGQIGQIVPGARADILLLPEDPAADLAALRRWKIEIADGRRYDRAVIDGWVSRYRRHFHGWFYATVMDGLTAIVVNQYRHAPADR
jgi:hypothetical protein